MAAEPVTDPDTVSSDQLRKRFVATILVIGVKTKYF